VNWWCGVGGEDACVMNYEGCLDDRWKMEWAADLPRVRAYCAVYCMRFTKYDYQKPRLPSSQLNLNSISTILNPNYLCLTFETWDHVTSTLP